MTVQHSLVERIKALAKALKGSDIGELDLTEQGTRIVIRRRLEPVASAGGRPGTAGAAPATGPQRVADPPAVPVDASVAIVAPLTGVFYGAASPSSPPFVQPGSTVSPGQIVCIVEAMKVFNEITCEVGGTVVSIHAEAGQLVHKGEALIRVRPA